MKEMQQAPTSQARPLSAATLLSNLVQGVFQAAVNRQLMPTVIAGFMYTVLQSEPASWLWTVYGMLLGTAIGLMFDEEAEEDLTSPFDRIDHAAMAVAMGLLVHLVIYT